jgi:hypothetical protein
MLRLPHKYRSLYLLALFQLVGGPVVLVAVILFGRLSVEHVAEHGLAVGITETLQSDEWQAATQELAQGVAGLPVKESDKVPVPPKETKDKLYTTDLDKPVTAPVISMESRTLWLRGDVFALARPRRRRVRHRNWHSHPRDTASPL